jgi:hypothetical protein
MQRSSLRHLLLPCTLAVIGSSLIFLSATAHSQTPIQPGDKTVWQSGSAIAASQVWIDASAFWTGGSPDLCVIINGILLGSTGYPAYPSSGAVIDARGLGGNGVTIGCLPGTPFSGVPATLPSTTILLPTGTIPINVTWTLPNNTRIVGEGPQTIIQAASTFSGTSYMIEMGSGPPSTPVVCPSAGSTYVCTSVGIEHLQLDAQHNSSVGGIDNEWAQGASYVNDVNVHQFSQTGLSVSAPNSGPYSNLSMSASGPSPSSATHCVVIAAQTRGLHGITCTGNATTGDNTGDAAILVNASNNSIEDVHVEGFWDALEIGSGTGTGNVGNIVVSNINGSSSGGCSSCYVVNVVHICGLHSTAPFGSCNSTSEIVTDVSVLAATNLTPYASIVNTTIADDVSQTVIEKCSQCQPVTTAFYSLGEMVGGGYSRFATNPANPNEGNSYGLSSTVVPTWGFGTSSITNGSPCYTPGALYSNTLATSGNSSVFACTYLSGTAYEWEAIVP